MCNYCDLLRMTSLQYCNNDVIMKLTSNLIGHIGPSHSAYKLSWPHIWPLNQPNLKLQLELHSVQRSKVGLWEGVYTRLEHTTSTVVLISHLGVLRVFRQELITVMYTQNKFLLEIIIRNKSKCQVWSVWDVLGEWDVWSVRVWQCVQ